MQYVEFLLGVVHLVDQIFFLTTFVRKHFLSISGKLKHHKGTKVKKGKLEVI